MKFMGFKHHCAYLSRTVCLIRCNLVNCHVFCLKIDSGEVASLSVLPAEIRKCGSMPSVKKEKQIRLCSPFLTVHTP